MKTSLLSFICAICLSSCNFVDDEYSVMPPEVKPHVDEFFRIATSKGLQINPSTLKIYYTTSLGGFNAGEAQLNSQIIRIDTTSGIWHINPESIIFHELGHVYLKRGHDDELIDGFDKSIMNTYGISYGPKVREYYINELFDPKTPPPTEWF